MLIIFIILSNLVVDIYGMKRTEENYNVTLPYIPEHEAQHYLITYTEASDALESQNHYNNPVYTQDINNTVFQAAKKDLEEIFAYFRDRHEFFLLHFIENQKNSNAIQKPDLVKKENYYLFKQRIKELSNATKMYQEAANNLLIKALLNALKNHNPEHLAHCMKSSFYRKKLHIQLPQHQEPLSQLMYMLLFPQLNDGSTEKCLETLAPQPNECHTITNYYFDYIKKFNILLTICRYGYTDPLNILSEEMPNKNSTKLQYACRTWKPACLLKMTELYRDNNSLNKVQSIFLHQLDERSKSQANEQDTPEERAQIETLINYITAISNNI
ncbi:hypothetical protein EKK58_04150 [Candidatus Dependentiae bacterium]|nr:MAG: hypothetical protein EKK58_04150 [Candidatus Dependentiae bacterium]